MKLMRLALEQVDPPADYPRHPDAVVLKNSFYPEGLTEYQVWRQLRNHADDLLGQLKGRRVMVVIKTDEAKIIRRNGASGDPLRIKTLEGLTEIMSGRTMEFHAVSEKEADLAWIDLDPQEQFPFSEVKSVAIALVPIMRKTIEADVSIKFSGGRGFHLLGALSGKSDVDALRHRLEASIRRFIDSAGGKLSLGAVRAPDMMRLDVSTLHESGSIRATWSLNADTGLVSVPLAADDLAGFEKGDARISLPRALHFTPFKEDPNSTSGQMRWRQRDPAEFDSFVTWRRWHGLQAPGLSFIAGPLKRPVGEMAVQSIRFDRSEWTAARAAAWWERHWIAFDSIWTQADWTSAHEA
jgi:hypothetical protein